MRERFSSCMARTDVGLRHVGRGADRLLAVARSRPPRQGSQPRDESPTPRSSADFLKRVDEYVALHKKLEAHAAEAARSSRRRSRSTRTSARSRKLIQAGAQGREAGRPPDAGDAAARSATLLRPVFAARTARQIKAEILDKEYKGNVKLAVNGRYPDEVPLSTMPPQVLAGRCRSCPRSSSTASSQNNLILFDPHAHIIADFMDARLQVESMPSMSHRRVADRAPRVALPSRSSAAPRRRARRRRAAAPRRQQPAAGQVAAARTSPTRCISPSSATTAPAKSRQYEIGEQMPNWYDRFQFPFVVMMGDNIYGSDRPQDFVKKFEAPYKALLDKGVKFYATLGNHDSREQRYYKLFNMDGKLYYTFKAPKEDVRFFALESTYMDPDQMKWLEDELEEVERELEDRLLPPSALFVGAARTGRS